MQSIILSNAGLHLLDSLEGGLSVLHLERSHRSLGYVGAWDAPDLALEDVPRVQVLLCCLSDYLQGTMRGHHCF